MQSMGYKNLHDGSIRSACNSAIDIPLWWDCRGMHTTQSSFAKSMNLNMTSSANVTQMKEPNQKLHDQDSSSTQSTGLSCEEVMMAGNAQEQFTSIQSGHQGTDGKRIDDGHVKSVLSLGNSEAVYSAPIPDYGQSVVRVPYPYTDTYLTGILSANGQHPIMHPQMMAIATAGRVPLPHELSDDGPIYVNAKQYRGILRRRQLRAKLEAQNKLVKGRKPYLHESRHLHAMKRIRGSGGRFLNTKKLQPAEQPNQLPQSNPSMVNFDGKKFSLTKVATATSEVAGISNDLNMFHLPDPNRFADFHIHGGISGGINTNNGSAGGYLFAGKM